MSAQASSNVERPITIVAVTFNGAAMEREQFLSSSGIAYFGEVIGPIAAEAIDSEAGRSAIANADIAVLVFGEPTFSNALRSLRKLAQRHEPIAAIATETTSWRAAAVARHGVDGESSEPSPISRVVAATVDAVQRGLIRPFRQNPEEAILTLREFLLSRSPQKIAPPAETPDPDDSPAGGFEDFPDSAFTTYARRIVELARRLGEARGRPATSVRRLVAAIILSGLEHRDEDRADGWLLRRIDPERALQRIRQHYPAIAKYEAASAILKAPLELESQMTPALRTTLLTAQKLARQARPTMQAVIGVRHLLGACVRRDDGATGAKRIFRDIGIDPDELRATILRELEDWNVDDDPDVWQQVLEGSSAERTPVGNPTYAPDSAAGPDLIGITREVEAMASLVSAWSVEPPLSIGLFGEWGSGKSFFMQKMKERVRTIAFEARKAGKAGAPQRDFGYYRNIVQVEFNAWHYVEGNLWASLVEHIFTNLRLEGDDSGELDTEENIRARFDRLTALLKDTTAETRRKEQQAKESEQLADAARIHADEKEAAAQQACLAADRAEADRIAAEKAAVQKHAKAQDMSRLREHLVIRDIKDALTGSDQIRDQVKEGLARFGITPERTASIDGLRDALKEATEAGTVVAQGAQALRSRAGWLILVLLFVIPIVLIASRWLLSSIDAFNATEAGKAVAAAITTLFTIAAAITTAWKTISPRLAPVLQTFRELKTKRDELEQRVENARLERAREAARHDEEVLAAQREAQKQQSTADDQARIAAQARHEAQAREAEARKAAELAAQAAAMAKKLEDEAEALRPERRIATFIKDRASAVDYRRHLGVAALVRRDFSKLEGMFRTQRKDEEARLDPKENRPEIVNRIILYIDDLDRCPPEKVVEVLRAIHLLLAFELFVVVVAVDARWMKRSLTDRFKLMLTRPSPATDDQRDQTSTDLSMGATATPDDYLEKIFQVPFWIRPLGKSGTRRLVTALTRADADSDQEAKQHTESNKPGRPSAQTDAPPGTSQEPTPPRPGEADGEPPTTPAESVSWSPVEPKPRTLFLTRDEREYMVALAPVIGRSPRSVKRFINCYRLLKASMDPVQLDRAHSRGTFRTTMTLLAIVTGFPEAAPAILADLRDSPSDQSPQAWVRDAMKRLTGEERGKWKEVIPIVSNLATWEVRTIGTLIDAAKLVDRFSFSPVRRPADMT